ncbi:molybdate transport system ATP-binding protein [Cognatiyoonia koreensis]|uniref:Molybdate transport system ATP-binding protein n=1 Tax=Cognatiyoonia koreensis TaxID=364200 RepID=A0A1I0MQN7_9RHOB|nr:molybdenum ABC transporter ATP-binding protein [Cognatiyoonia koreensis]SEV90869.1 molybdate transport system ATP-binding protein [Cognatiyoonia koreensis]
MIEVDIQHRLGDFALDASFSTPVGVTALFGRSGSGKTSIINAIAGLLRPDRGRVSVNGAVFFDTDKGIWLPPHKRRVGYVFQDARLFPHLSVHQNLRYGGQHDEARIICLLGLQGLLERQPNRLSGGERQRVALGRALMCDPQLLLLDEPLAALDGPRKAEILPYLEALRDTAEIPIIYVSHAIAEVARLGTSLAVIRNGRVARVGPLEEVMADPASLALLGRADAGAVLTAVVQRHDSDDALTEVACAGGTVLLQGKIGQVGARLRLRVPAQDIILSTQAPAGLSALNALPVEILGITEGDGPALAVSLKAGDERLLAQISTRSARAMNLSVGSQVYAIFKVTAATPDFGQGES